MSSTMAAASPMRAGSLPKICTPTGRSSGVVAAISFENSLPRVSPSELTISVTTSPQPPRSRTSPRKARSVCPARGARMSGVARRTLSPLSPLLLMQSGLWLVNLNSFITQNSIKLDGGGGARRPLRHIDDLDFDSTMPERKRQQVSHRDFPARAHGTPVERDDSIVTEFFGERPPLDEPRLLEENIDAHEGSGKQVANPNYESTTALLPQWLAHEAA